MRKPVHGLVRSVLRLQYEICVLQATNVAWRLGNEAVLSSIMYSFLHRRARLDETRTVKVDSVPRQLKSNPEWVLELRVVPMGACSGK